MLHSSLLNIHSLPSHAKIYGEKNRPYSFSSVTLACITFFWGKTVWLEKDNYNADMIAQVSLLLLLYSSEYVWECVCFSSMISYQFDLTHNKLSFFFVRHQTKYNRNKKVYPKSTAWNFTICENVFSTGKALMMNLDLVLEIWEWGWHWNRPYIW